MTGYVRVYDYDTEAAPMNTDDIVETVRAWAKAYRDTPEHRFPSDPHAEFFPVDLEAICDEVVKLRAQRDAAKDDARATHREVNDLRFERDAAAQDMRERCAKVIDENMACGNILEILRPRADGNKVGLAYSRAIRALPLIATDGGTSND